MKDIEFIPKEFHNVKLGYYESAENKCTPYYTNYELYLDNEIRINIPKRIIIKRPISEISPVVPVCGAYVISIRRGLKYSYLSTRMLYIRNINNNIWHSGEIVDFDNEYPPIPLNYEEEMEEEKERQEEIKEAQNYSDDELNAGQYAGSAINVDLMEYVDFPLESGVYEVYLAFAGLESNRARVEIVFEGEAKKQPTSAVRTDFPEGVTEIVEDEVLPEI